MEHGIGAAAGQVWKFLKEKGESSTSAIVKGTKLSSTEVHRAIGWLAREDKINYISRGGNNFVSLIDHEREYYLNVFRPSVSTPAKREKAKKVLKGKK